MSKHAAFVLLFAGTVFLAPAYSLPFNDDMVNGQLKTGQVMRAKPEHSIPVGGAEYQFTKEEAEQMQNPVATSEESVARGKRLFSANCHACHGFPVKEGYKPNVAGAFMGAPNLSDPGFHAPAEGAEGGRTDGQIFRVVHFGNVLMPRVGWKLSQTETWDIVNYVRSTQK
ncbi:MAG: c-type cytochrome [Bdellovibrionales bacterium]|nr:c-type cytochrome [Bdellovibrionales bacterium]